MRNFRNYYEILGISAEATEEEIKRAFRQLARQYHPDLNPGNKVAEERFKELGEAYEVLSDRDKRVKYDGFSQYWEQEGFESAADMLGDRRNADQRERPNDGFGQFPDFDEFVDQLLGPRSQSRTVPVGDLRDRRGFEDSFEGDSRSASTAGVKSGSSAEFFRPSTSKTSYTVTARPNPRDIDAPLSLPLERAYAGGRERIRLEDGRTLEVEMPGGLVTGQQIRLRNQGLQGGDLYLQITVLPHRFFRLEGVDLYCTVPITLPEAVLGAPVMIPTLDGPVTMNLPVGARDRQRLRLAEKGYPGATGGRGDQIIELQWVLPTNLSDAEQALYEQLLTIATASPRANLLYS
jgi:curved DNA-binding protein